MGHVLSLELYMCVIFFICLNNSLQCNGFYFMNNKHNGVHIIWNEWSTWLASTTAKARGKQTLLVSQQYSKYYRNMAKNRK